jgi:uncharacterized protein YbjT (DUF2867 family)
MESSKMRLLLLGASGLVGSRTLELALSSDAISELMAPTRNPLAPDKKLLNPVGSRLADLLPAVDSFRPDAVICALGTTMATAGSKEAFLHVDYELPIAFGKAARGAGAKTFVLVSAMGASLDSRFFYPRTKGQVERDIMQIGFPSLTICRPSLIDGRRNETRRAEGAALTLARLLSPLLPKKFRVNPAESIAAALLDAAIAARPGCQWINSQEMS